MEEIIKMFSLIKEKELLVTILAFCFFLGIMYCFFHYIVCEIDIRKERKINELKSKKTAQ